MAKGSANKHTWIFRYRIDIYLTHARQPNPSNRWFVLPSLLLIYFSFFSLLGREHFKFLFSPCVHRFVYAVVVFMVFAFCMFNEKNKHACNDVLDAAVAAVDTLLFRPLLMNASLLLLHNNKCKPWWWVRKKRTNTNTNVVHTLKSIGTAVIVNLRIESQSVHCFRTSYEMFFFSKEKKANTLTLLCILVSPSFRFALSCLVEQTQLHTKDVERLLLCWLLLLLFAALEKLIIPGILASFVASKAFESLECKQYLVDCTVCMQCITVISR